MTQSTPKTRRWVMPVLALSLAANLLVIGMAAGTFWRFKDMRPGAGSGPGGRIAMVRAMDKEDRQAVFDELRAGRDVARTVRRGHQKTMLSALRAEPFDAATLRDVLNAQHDQAAVSRQSVEAKWLDIVSQMTPAKRAAYADRLQRAFEKGPRKGSRPQGD